MTYCLAKEKQPIFPGNQQHLQHLTFLVKETKERNNRTLLPTLKNNAAACYQGPVKIKLLKGAGLLDCPIPYSPDSAIWHKMQLHAQYSVNLREICTTKRSWKNLHMEGIISCPPPKQDLIYHPCNFWNFLSLYFLGRINI